MIRTVAETGSTNADMIALAANGASDGLWLRADRQTAGRGRQGRDWQSPAGNLHASTLVRLRPHDPPAATLALVTAVALQEVVAVYLPADAPPAMLKWPNDLLLAGAKLSGILLERTGDAVVIGIGVNIAAAPPLPDRATVCLADHGVDITPSDFLETLAAAFDVWMGRWRTIGMAPVRDRWMAHAHPPGTPLSAHLPDGRTIEGMFERLEGDGALILRLADGDTRVIHAGDVFLL